MFSYLMSLTCIFGTLLCILAYRFKIHHIPISRSTILKKLFKRVTQFVTLSVSGHLSDEGCFALNMYY